MAAPIPTGAASGAYSGGAQFVQTGGVTRHIKAIANRETFAA